MPHKIIKLFFIFLLFFTSKTYGDFIVCDSGNINYEGITVSEICNGGYESLDISLIKSFTGSYVNFDLGFWGISNNLDLENNVKNNFPVGFFDGNKKTITKKVDPEYFNFIGFIGTANSFSGVVFDVENNFPIGFFDLNKKTIILKEYLNYSFPVGYLGDYQIRTSGRSNSIPVIQNITYRDFFHEIFLKNIDSKFLRKYSNYELNLFIDDLLNVLFEGKNEANIIISNSTKKRIELYIKKSSFIENLNKLVNNLDPINDAFKKNEIVKQRFYVIKYYLQK
ncbi:MAG: hypothetical protein QM490_02455 [Candidatus Gracilibacteria bacterium]